MGMIFIGVAALAAYIYHDTWVFIPALINAIASFWGNGVLLNYPPPGQLAPDWAAAMSMFSTFIAVTLIVASFVF